MITSSYIDKMGETRYNEMVQKVGPYVIDIFNQFKNELGGTLPAELSYGMVAGYLRGKGLTWEEAFVGMNRHICIIESMGVVSEEGKGTFSILGKGDGTVEIETKVNP